MKTTKEIIESCILTSPEMTNHIGDLMKEYAREAIDKLVEYIEDANDSSKLFTIYPTNERRQNVSRFAIKLFKERKLI